MTPEGKATTVKTTFSRETSVGITIYASPSIVWRLLSGSLTFLCVVVAGVFFRADSVEAALVVLDAMRGNAAGIPAAWVPTREALKIVIGCGVLVWLFPNTRQMLLRYRPTWDDLAGDTSADSARPGWTHRLLLWRPGVLHAVAIAVVFIWSVDGLTKVSQFLYFTF